MAASAITESDLKGSLPLVARGKVRDLYAVDDQTLLFVASDRISAYDVIMQNGIPNKGALLNLLSAHWFAVLTDAIPDLRTHLVSLAIPSSVPKHIHPQLQNRSMQVRRLQIFPIEAIVRGYITGSAWKEYQKSGTVHGIKVPEGLRESEEFPGGAIYTPSTKAEAGKNDENIHPDAAAAIVGEKYAKRIEELALKLYKTAKSYAKERGIIIADTKFEFGLDPATDEIVLVDEVLTPDSSRFWPAASYAIGQGQDSFDKQFLRDWLTNSGLKGKEGVSMPEEIAKQTAEKYQEAFERLVGHKWADALTGKSATA
ncbi:phosphoribosyl-aminoimidazole-succinocarboxamide synthase [Xylona heveae TC161]|uniref:Phosphoribosylaminoimidazole-succinocarboxamide synthase n=1 Tax=Xylona heveae (strain CBS 132557 / TC161) TaxID=1328760 RepID=A0A165IN21_XYLHT|nr:phosphoribosyl-aminoimidazole-succinocarboxamide synthase [Xylona heveae TC161]KZF25134.1 phosphoribosyl-aminoimidazole-succinocarboxamide synthase [Xylona heveae TC161]